MESGASRSTTSASGSPPDRSSVPVERCRPPLRRSSGIANCMRPDDLFERVSAMEASQFAGLFDVRLLNLCWSRERALRAEVRRAGPRGWPGDRDLTTSGTTSSADHIDDIIVSTSVSMVSRAGTPLRMCPHTVSRPAYFDGSPSPPSRRMSPTPLSADGDRLRARPQALFVVEEQLAWAPHLRSSCGADGCRNCISLVDPALLRSDRDPPGVYAGPGDGRVLSDRWSCST